MPAGRLIGLENRGFASLVPQFNIERLTHAAYAWLDQCVWRIQSGEMPVADIAMLKVQATRTLERTARDSMQLLGGGTEEILDDLAGRQMKF